MELRFWRQRTNYIYATMTFSFVRRSNRRRPSYWVSRAGLNSSLNRKKLTLRCANSTGRRDLWTTNFFSRRVSICWSLEALCVLVCANILSLTAWMMSPERNANEIWHCTSRIWLGSAPRSCTSYRAISSNSVLVQLLWLGSTNVWLYRCSHRLRPQRWLMLLPPTTDSDVVWTTLTLTFC